MPKDEWIVTDELKEKMGLMDNQALDPEDVDETEVKND